MGVVTGGSRPVCFALGTLTGPWVNGAQWTLAQFDTERACCDDGSLVHGGLPVEMGKVVVAVDPSGTEGDGVGDCVSIVVAGLGVDGRFYILENATCNLSPEQWARRVIAEPRTIRPFPCGERWKRPSGYVAEASTRL